MWPPNESFLRAVPLGEYLRPDTPIRVSVATLACFFLFIFTILGHRRIKGT